MKKCASCRQLEEARSALRVICTWATFRNGEMLDPRDVARLCRKALGRRPPTVSRSDQDEAVQRVSLLTGISEPEVRRLVRCLVAAAR